MLVIIVIILLLAVLVAPPIRRQKGRVARVACGNNLRIIGAAFSRWALGHSNQFPARVSTAFGGSQQHSSEAFRHFQLLSNELVSPQVLICPADTRHSAKDFGPSFSNSNVSYFVGLDVMDDESQVFLAGDRNLTNGSPPKNGILTLRSNDIVGWTHEMHKGTGQILMPDGSVQMTSSGYMPGMLIYETNRLAMP